MNILYFLGRKLIKLYFYIFYRLSVRYESPLPSGPFIFAINHPTSIDPLIVSTLSRRQLVTLISNDVFSIPVIGKLIRLSGNIPVVKTSGGDVFPRALGSLKRGKSLAIYIEGGISPHSGQKLHIKTGAVRLASLSGCPVVPVGVAIDKSRLFEKFNMFGGTTKTTFWYPPGPYAVTVGKPIYIKEGIEDRKYVRAKSYSIYRQVKKLEQASQSRIKPWERWFIFPFLRLSSAA
jgi:1-acyl-sn-glycerol-3-phosphate acyltransferase